jgi:hypothetical protein
MQCVDLTKPPAGDELHLQAEASEACRIPLGTNPSFVGDLLGVLLAADFDAAFSRGLTLTCERIPGQAR